MAGLWGSVLTAMVTPFDTNGALNLDGACQLARWLAANGTEGIVLAGTNGEASTLSDAERFDLIKAVAEAVTVPVIAGMGTNDTRHSIELTRHAASLGAAGVMAVGPYYNRPPQEGIEAHYRAIADATKLPVMLYDVPGRTGRRIAHEVLARLFRDVSNIVAFKDATGDPAGAAALIAEVGEFYDHYSGDDSLTLPLLAVGAAGVVGTATHWVGPEFASMIAAYDRGDVIKARQINASLMDTFAFSNSETSVFSMSIKAMMRTLDIPVGECRLPLPPAPAEKENEARRVWARLRGNKSL
jgi:4-hydroxy-tetrahydrodipicolinate synthase